VLESKEDMAKGGLASPDDGDALALTFAWAVAPVKVPRRDPTVVTRKSTAMHRSLDDHVR
jgi:hypothetical protein